MATSNVSRYSPLGSHQRSKERAVERFFWSYYPLVIHIIFSVVITALMLGFVDGRVVNYDGVRIGKGIDTLRASDITTAASAALVLVRLMTTAWTTFSAWRCAFILLETDGLTLLQFNRVISWRICWPSLLGWSWYSSTACLVLILLAPSNLVAPVLLGAVGWRDTTRPVSQHSIPYLKQMSPPEFKSWYKFTKTPRTRLRISQKAAGRVAVAWTSSHQSDTSICRHVIPFDDTMPVNSTINGAFLPCIDIHNISWGDKSEFLNDTSFWIDSLNMKQHWSLANQYPFNYNHRGTAALFNSTFFQRYNSNNASYVSTTLPQMPSSVFTGVQTIALLLAQQNRTNCAPEQTIFGNQSAMAQLKPYSSIRVSGDGGEYENCFLIGTVNFTAGVIRNQTATYVLPRVIEAKRTPDIQIEPDLLVAESLNLMPDVMPLVSLMNVSRLETWENLDGYVENLIRVSFMATWDAMNEAYYEGPEIFLTGHKHIPCMRAVVSQLRVYVWFVAQLLVIVSSVVMWFLQCRIDRPIIIDGGAASLMVDAKPVLKKFENEDGLTRMSYAMGNDCSGEKIQLVRNPKGGHHLQLKVKRRTAGSEGKSS